LPALLITGLFFFESMGILLLFTLSGYLYLAMIFLAKYAAYPNEINLAQAIIIALTFVFPPLLLAIIPFFAFQSIHRLNGILR
jgi:predicted transglutaminase-like protease